MDQIIKSIEAPVNPNIPELRTGDVVNVHVKIKEGTRERIQVFKGTVLYKHNNGTSSTFTVRRVASNGIGVERTFPIHTPNIALIEVVRKGRVRRAKLNYIRTLSAKAARIKERK